MQCLGQIKQNPSPIDMLELHLHLQVKKLYTQSAALSQDRSYALFIIPINNKA
eukprot:m.29616 g.29616  ORF g.29616 m.29616 type:complete len:53 (+) comp8118_c0_seq4:1809-1967(+)